jgi:tetratricopeptide (TPR) repeat protein
VEHEWQELYNHGIAFYLKKDYWGAEESFKRILVNNRKDADVYFQLGKLYMKKKDPKNAKKMLRKYLSFDVEGKWEQEAEGYLAELQSGEPLPLSPLL